MLIRLLTRADAADYWAFRLEALEREPEAFSSAAEDHRATSVEDAAARMGSDPASDFTMGAFADGQLAGMARFHREPGLKERHKGRIFGVYVTGRARGGGIGRKLMEELLRRVCTIDGIEQILLTVSTTQAAAIRLYRSLGFQSYGCERGALKIGGRYIDKEYMALRISERAGRFSSGDRPGGGLS